MRWVNKTTRIDDGNYFNLHPESGESVSFGDYIREEINNNK